MSKNWCSSDKTTYEGKKIESLTSQCGLKQVISDPTHILESSSSRIDLIFTSQPNLVFSNKGVSKQISIFNETILNIMTNFIPNETEIFNDQEHPWINNKVKIIIQEKKLSALFEK